MNDLIDTSKKNLEIRESPNKGIFVNNLSEIIVTNVEKAMQILNKGENNRIIAETKLNEKSSRSHTIFKINIEFNIKEKKYCSQLNLVDLAGSENVSKAKCEGMRIKEGGNINKSLLALSSVINKLSQNNKSFVNYRDSKLTRLLQSALGGNSKTTIICTMIDDINHYSETLNTLHFGIKAKNISFKDGSFAGLNLFETSENTIGELYLNGSTFTVKNGVLIYAKKINVTESKFIISDEKTLQLESDGSIKITDSTLAVDNCSLKFKQIGECYSLIDHSNIKCKSITFDGEDYDDETVDGLIDSTNRSVSIKESSIHVSEISATDILGGIKLTDTGIHEIKSIDCSNVNGFKGENSVLFTDGYPTKLSFKDGSKIIGSELTFDDEDSSSVNEKTIEISDSTVQSVDIGTSNDSNEASILNVVVNNCPSTRMTFTPSGEELKVKISVKDSLNSLFWGASSSVTVVPKLQDLSSDDIAAYNSSDENKVVAEKVTYGSSS